MNRKEFKKMISENIRNNKEWNLTDISEINGGFSDDDIDEVFTYKKGDNELVIESNIYNEQGSSFKYNGQYLEDSELLHLLEEKQLINIIDHNINKDFSWKVEHSYQKLDDFLSANFVVYKKDNSSVRIIILPGEVTIAYINGKKSEKEELVEYINEMFNIEQKNIKKR